MMTILLLLVKLSDVIAWVVRGCFVLISKARLHFIRKGITVRGFNVTAEATNSYPCLRIKFEVASKTDAVVNVRELSLKLLLADWELGQMVLHPHANKKKSLVRKIQGRKHGFYPVEAVFSPPLYFWLKRPSEVTLADGHLLVESIWGTTDKTFCEDGEAVEVVGVKDIASRFVDNLKAHLSIGG